MGHQDVSKRTTSCYGCVHVSSTIVCVVESKHPWDPGTTYVSGYTQSLKLPSRMALTYNSMRISNESVLSQKSN